jgi:predicted CXXCH cytochrome family protein
MAPKKKKTEARSGVLWLVGLAALVVAAVMALRSGGKKASPAFKGAPMALATNDDAVVFAGYGSSPSCKACHEEAYKAWAGSHHALAERLVEPRLDGPAFDPPKEIQHGTQTSKAQIDQGKLQLVTAALEGQKRPFVVDRVLGVDPLRQFLVAAPGGRWQATELVFDPSNSEWFDVYGKEDRQPGEWGHWTGRGMNWNAMCAACHNTRLRKNYREETDSYATSMAEMGVGCESCHGPMADHNAWQARHPNQSGDPTVRTTIRREEMFSVCGSCHARRAELTGDFKPGDRFLDHYSLTIPDDTDLFYPDGQIREEDYEYNAFLGSRMHAAGVRCADCHEPHSAKTRVSGNNLCYICHAGPAPPAPKIEAATHTHHEPGEPGDRCVDCHMPQTVYMQRHSRHDHGFTVPDPLLTKELGIPNACGRCHAERTVDWLIAAVDRWYGEKMERPGRRRTRIIARARQGLDGGGAAPLAGLLRSETNSYWRASAAGLLRQTVGQPVATGALLGGVGDVDPLVRAMSLRALERPAQAGNPRALEALRSRTNDPVRLVRIDAAWGLHSTIGTNAGAGLDLVNYLRHNADQLAGAMQLGVFHMDRGDLDTAMAYLKRAAQWDTNSAPPHHALAVALSIQGKTEEAVAELRTACRLAPREAEFRFKLGLALNETGKLEEALAALQAAVKLDPQFAQAWYNLGLAYNGTGKSDSALEALVRAESIDQYSPQIPYARATILARLGRRSEARMAAIRALEIQPGYPEADRLLRTLSQ